MFNFGAGCLLIFFPVVMIGFLTIRNGRMGLVMISVPMRSRSPKTTVWRSSLFARRALINTIIWVLVQISIKNYIEKYNLLFLLLADEDHQVSEMDEAWKLKKMYGEAYISTPLCITIIKYLVNMI